MKTRLAPLALLCLFSCLAFFAAPARAGDHELKGMYAQPSLENKKYYICTEDKNCVTADMPCGRKVVVNTQMQKEVQGWNDFVAPQYQCLATAGRQQVDNIRCDQGMCKGDISLVPQVLPDTPLAHDKSWCETIDDCAVVEGPCHAKLAVNRTYQKALQKDYDTARQMHMEKCTFPDNRTVERLHCNKNKCEADLKIPDQSHWSRPVDMRDLSPRD